MLSIILPAYNEGEMIYKSSEVISKLLEDNKIEYEILYVDDGSKDETWPKIMEMSK